MAVVGCGELGCRGLWRGNAFSVLQNYLFESSRHLKALSRCALHQGCDFYPQIIWLSRDIYVGKENIAVPNMTKRGKVNFKSDCLSGPWHLITGVRGGGKREGSQSTVLVEPIGRGQYRLCRNSRVPSARYLGRFCSLCFSPHSWEHFKGRIMKDITCSVQNCN